jgi:hypothetical protein
MYRQNNHSTGTSSCFSLFHSLCPPSRARYHTSLYNRRHNAHESTSSLPGPRYLRDKTATMHPSVTGNALGSIRRSTTMQASVSRDATVIIRQKMLHFEERSATHCKIHQEWTRTVCRKHYPLYAALLIGLKSPFPCICHASIAQFLARAGVHLQPTCM